MMQELEIVVSDCRGRLLKEESLAQFTSWRTGGPAQYVYLPSDLKDLSCFLSQLDEKIPLTWIGLGSNTLIRDGGIDGVVVVTQGALNKMESLSSAYEVRAEAGVACAQLARFTARQSAAGLEFMAGIPGTVGGALAMNAGCFGSETWRHVKAVETITRRGEVKSRSSNDFQVDYRHVERPIDEWFVAGIFGLQPGDKEKSLDDIRTLLDRRSHTQPTGTANCGSVFRNPEGDYAGRLIEQCGLKGKQIGGAHVSTKHANFIINENQASAADIEHLIAEVRQVVEKETGILLTPEVCIIGKS